MKTLEEKEDSIVVKTKLTESSYIHKQGFTVVYEPEGLPEHDLILVHGLKGDPFDTWRWKHTKSSNSNTSTTKETSKLGRIIPGRRGKNKIQAAVSEEDRFKESTEDPQRSNKSQTYWPSELLSVSFPNARVLVYGYDSHVSHFFSEATNQNNIFSLGRGFLNDLAAQRCKDPQRPLVLLAHSLGGLVVKEALRRSRNANRGEDEDLAAVLQSTVAILFFGTPHRGSAYAKIGLTAARIVSMAGFSINDQNVRDLKGNSGVLENLREEFSAILDSGTFRVTTFQEATGPTRSSFIDRKIVDDMSSGLDHDYFERKIPLARNHMDMCRFYALHDPDYGRVSSEITRHLNRWQKGQDQPQDDRIRSLYIPEMYHRARDIGIAYPKTLQWIFKENEGPGLVQWLQKGAEVFWIQGKPGSGKSTAMRYISTHPELLPCLQKSSPGDWAIIDLFFTDRAGEMQRSWFGMLCAILHNLLSQFPKLERPFLAWLEKETIPPTSAPEFHHKARNIWTEKVLQRALIFCKTQRFVKFRVCLLIDALDEHEGSHQTMGKNLKNLAQSAGPGQDFNIIKICVSSRPYNELKDLLYECPGFEIHQWTMKDIESYAFGRLMENRRMQQLQAVDYTRKGAEELIEEVIQRAKGVFLWVRLVIDELFVSLTNGLPPSMLLKVLEDLPEELDEYFLHMFRKVDTKHRKLSHLILESVVCSIHEVTLERLALILKTNTDGAYSSDNLLLQVLGLERQISSFTGGLLEVVERDKFDSRPSDGLEFVGKERKPFSWFSWNDVGDLDRAPYSKIVQPIHQTVKEFLTGSSNLEKLKPLQNLDQVKTESTFDGHYYWLQTISSIFENCDLARISEESLDSLSDQMATSCRIYGRDKKEDCYPLFSRLSKAWEAEHEVRKWRLMFGARVLRYSNLLNLKDQEKASFFYFAAATNLYWLMESALTNRIDINSDNIFPIALILAISCPLKFLAPYPNEDVLDLLLEKANTMEKVSFKIPGREDAHSADALGILFLAIDEIPQTEGRRPLVPTIIKLLDHGCDPNAKIKLDSNIARPLLSQLAKSVFSLSKPDLLDAMESLIERGARPSIIDDEDTTFLEHLFYNHSIDVPMRTWAWFLEHGALISGRMASSLYEGDKYYHNHPLLDPELHKIEYYDLEARNIAWKHNSSWWTVGGRYKHAMLRIKGWTRYSRGD